MRHRTRQGFTLAEPKRSVVPAQAGIHLQKAFTLVELSIVLVILGLLVGGVLTGQSLIRAAELRSVTTQYNGYVTAVNSFKDKYFALPGDMTNAQSFWGVAHATAATCKTTASTGTLTCNGDGNGAIDSSAASSEYYRFWQHLANAGLIEGTYNGISGAGGGNDSSSANSPRGKLSNSLWFSVYWGTLNSSTNYFNGVYNNTLTLGSVNASTWPGIPVFKPEELWNIDTKMDDGKPATGKLVVYATLNLCTDTSSDSNLAANYLLNGTSATCVAIFPRAF